MTPFFILIIIFTNFDRPQALTGCGYGLTRRDKVFQCLDAYMGYETGLSCDC